MDDQKLAQLHHEVETWKRLIQYVIGENIILKTRLSEVLMQKFDARLLEEVEYFQNCFIKQDELIGLLRNDVAELEHMVLNYPMQQGINTALHQKLEHSRINLLNVAQPFFNLVVEFNRYVQQKFTLPDMMAV